MASEQAVYSQILSEARRYFETYNYADLEELLAEVWAKIESEAIPVRSGDSRGVKMARRFIQSLSEHSEVASYTSGLIVNDIVKYLADSGLSISQYGAPAAIIAALAVNAILKEWRDTPPPTSGAPPA